MKFNMTALALVLIGALTANAANLRSNSSGHFPACPQGGWTWNPENSHCYKSFPKESFPDAPEPGTTEPILKANQWDTAKKRCAKYDAYIAVPNDATENTFIRGMITTNSDEELFLGYDQSGLTESLWLDGTVQHAPGFWQDPDAATGYDAAATPIRLPKGLKQAFRTTNPEGDSLAWVPVTGTKVKPVLVMQTDGSWRFDYKHLDLPFVCELIWCRHGCNPREKSPAPKNSTNTVVATQADGSTADHEQNPFMSR